MAINLDNDEIKKASVKELYREYKKENHDTKEKKLISELLRRVAVIEAKVNNNIK